MLLRKLGDAGLSPPEAREDHMKVSNVDREANT